MIGAAAEGALPGKVGPGGAVQAGRGRWQLNQMMSEAGTQSSMHKTGTGSQYIYMYVHDQVMRHTSYIT